MKTPENEAKRRAQEMLETITDIICDEPALITGFALVNCLQDLPIRYRLAAVEALIKGLPNEGLVRLAHALTTPEAAE